MHVRAPVNIFGDQMSTIGERLREERERLSKNQVDFGKLGGVSKRAQINYEQGVRQPDTEYLSALAKAGVDVTYVVTGSRPSVAQKIADDLKQAKAEIELLMSLDLPQSDYERTAEFLANFARLDDEAKKTVEMMIKTLLTKK